VAVAVHEVHIVCMMHDAGMYVCAAHQHQLGHQPPPDRPLVGLNKVTEAAARRGGGGGGNRAGGNVRWCCMRREMAGGDLHLTACLQCSNVCTAALHIFFN
jgi:hypothetical protein